MEKLLNIHPGEVLKEEFLDPLGISAYRLSKETFMPQTRISQIIHKKRSITADTALRLSKYFRTSAKFWLGLQDDYDLEEESENKKKWSGRDQVSKGKYFINKPNLSLKIYSALTSIHANF